ncbi:MAG: type II toxin-antitoxin system Phd/YefM family antitoxin [Anaerolineae bacterium]
MKIVVSVNELATETQVVIDNMRRSKAPVMIGDADKPVAVLLSMEEYERLQRQAQAAASPEMTQPIAPPAPTAAAPKEPSPVAAPPAPEPAAPAEVASALQPSHIAQRTAAAIESDRTSPEPKAVSPRQATMQPAPAPAADRTAALRNMRLSRPLPKPPRPLQPPSPRRQLSLSPEAIPGGWQTIALIVGVLVLGIVGFALIVNALSG